MNIRPIEPQDMNEIESWLAYRRPEHIDIDLSALPATGFIAPGVAAFFYSLTNAPVMWIEAGVSNPHAELAERRRAGEMFAGIIYGIIRENKIPRVLFLTKCDVVHEFYGKLIGAKPVGQFTLYKACYSWGDGVEGGQ